VYRAIRFIGATANKECSPELKYLDDFNKITLMLSSERLV
jgi:hypothetical protein